MASETETTRYRAVMPELPEEPDENFELVDYWANLNHSTEEVDEHGRTLPPRTKTRRRIRRAEPTEATDEGDRFWPVFKRDDGVAVHPAVVAHDVASGSAVLEDDDEDVERILAELSRRTGDNDVDDYHRVLRARVRAERDAARRRLAELVAGQPRAEFDEDGGVQAEQAEAWLVPISDVAALFGRSERWVKQQVDRRHLPQPVRVGRQAVFFRSTDLERAFAA